MTITPLYPQILVKPIVPTLTTGGGIRLPDYVPDMLADRGIVLKSTIDQIKEGDIVIWKEYTGIEIDDLILIDAFNCLVTYENKKA